MRVASVEKLWPALAKYGCEVVVLRDFENLPAAVRSDLDIAVRNRGELPLVEAAVSDFAELANLELVTIVKRSYVWQFKLVGRIASEQLVVDVHTEGEGWRGPLYLTTEELFAEAVNRDGWRIPALHHQIMMAVFQHLLWGGFYKKKYHHLVPDWIERCEPKFEGCVARAFGADVARTLVQHLKKSEVAKLEAMVPLLRGRLWRMRGLPDLGGSLKRLAQFAAAEIRLMIGRPGRWVVLIGPDGVGKTTVAHELKSQLQPFFRSMRYHYWIPIWWKGTTEAAPPGGSKPVARRVQQGLLHSLLSLLRLTRNVLHAYAGYLVRVLPHLLRGRLVLGDRYMFNYVLDPSSVRFYASPRIAAFALKVVPKPDLVLCLRAPAEVVYARKPELTVAEIESLLDRVPQLTSLGYRVRYVDATAEAALVTETVAREIAMTLIGRRDTRTKHWPLENSEATP